MVRHVLNIYWHNNVFPSYKFYEDAPLGYVTSVTSVSIEKTRKTL